MERKLVFFDIDGTLVSDDSEHIIPSSAREAVRQLGQSGSYALINTGRSYFNVDENIKSLGFDGYACGCGTHIILEGEEIYYRTIPKDECLRLRDMIKKADAAPIYERRDKFFYDTASRDIGWMGKLKQLYKDQGKTVTNDAQDEDFSFDKFCIWYDERTDMDFFHREISEGYDFIDRGEGFAEIVPKGCSKATAMTVIAEKLGIDREDIFAIGDSLNDLPMLKAAGTGICIGKNNLLWKQADYVADELRNDGLAKALEHFGLI